MCLYFNLLFHSKKCLYSNKNFQGESDKNVFDSIGGSEAQFEQERQKVKKEKKTKKKKKKKEKVAEPVQVVQGLVFEFFTFSRC